MYPNFNRRQFLTSAASTIALSGWLGRLAAQMPDRRPAKSCILLWMAGGPSHLDTFDLKPDAPAEIRGEFRPIATSVPGIQISEHFPRFAGLMKHAAIMRGMSTLESDHNLATYHLHTGYQNRAGAVAFPSLGALVASELGNRDVALPNFVKIGRGPQGAPGSGFLGPDNQPLAVTDPVRGLDYIEPAGPLGQFQRQLGLLRKLDAPFHQNHASAASKSHRSAMDRAVRLMTSEQKRAFDLSLEPDQIRDTYGRPGNSTGKAGTGKVIGETGGFGQACLMARRLVEAGIPFVEVVMGDGAAWDTHRDNFPRTRELSRECDTAMAALVEDLERRGRLDTTLVVWMGEFGRTPQCAGGGRNHWARAWSTLLVGGGIKGGQVIGRTDQHAAEVVERPVSVVDFLATLCTILGIDYTRQYHPPGVDRPISIVDTSKPIKVISELL
jgi:hypothetical protein